MRTIGVLGGMGPEATVDFLAKIVRATPAARDQDHLHVLVDSNPAVPDRSAAIAGRGPDPAPVLREMAEHLVAWGAEVLVMPCNTAHYFHERVSAGLAVPLLHMMRETADHIRRGWPTARTVGLLATDATISAGLYHRALANRGLDVLVPDRDAQAMVMGAIFGADGVKAGHHHHPRRWLEVVAAGLVAQGADVVVAGCTEVPVVLSATDVTVPLVDATEVLARAAVREGRRDH